MRWSLVVALVALGGCPGAEQSESCREFVACVHEIDTRDGVRTDAIRFEADGACWSSPTIAELCDRACTRGVATLRRTDPTLVCEVVP